MLFEKTGFRGIPEARICLGMFDVRMQFAYDGLVFIRRNRLGWLHVTSDAAGHPAKHHDSVLVVACITHENIEEALLTAAIRQKMASNRCC